MNLSTKDLQLELSRRRHLDFIRHCWRKPDPFIEGYHTKIIGNLMDEAIEKYKKGISSYYMIKLPFRHGKSDLVSRYLPANFIGKFPDEDVIVNTYSAKLVEDFSSFAREVMRSDKYKEIYPDVKLSEKSQSLDKWGIENHLGNVFWIGLGGSVSGRGGSLIILDDFFSGRQDAESELVRHRTWEAITNDLLTRRAPTSIFIILATPWHVDDPFGRIKIEMDKNPDFPKFQEIKLPAMSPEYPSGTLFPERYNLTWYKEQAASLGLYGTASLLQCEPTVREGNIFKVDKIKVIDPVAVPDNIPFTMGWDLASSTKQRVKDDPDYTVGIKLGLCKVNGVSKIYITDMVRGRWEAPERDKIILETSVAAGHLTIGVESFGPYKDAFTTLKRILMGKRVVKKIQLPGDKITKAAVLEPIIEAGNFHIVRAPWNMEFMEEFANFPGGRHDDCVDSVVTAYSTHNPDQTHIWEEYTPSDTAPPQQMININWMSPEPGCSLVCFQWVDDNMETSCLLGLWNVNKSYLYIYGEAVLPSPQPEPVLTALSELSRRCTNNVVRNMKPYDWFGNKLMFSKNVSTDLQSAYRRYNCYIRDNDKFDMHGAMQLVNRLLWRRRLFVHPRCVELSRQMEQWSIENNEPAPGHSLCMALCGMTSGLHEMGKLTPTEKPMRRYSKERTEFDREVSNDLAAPQELNESRFGWM